MVPRRAPVHWPANVARDPPTVSDPGPGPLGSMMIDDATAGSNEALVCSTPAATPPYIFRRGTRSGGAVALLCHVAPMRLIL